jgi:hypothetical protein
MPCRAPANDLTHSTTSSERIFFSILALFNKIREMNPDETYFQHLALRSHAISIDPTYEGVATVTRA